MELSIHSFLFYKLLSLNIIFFQDHLFISSIETTVVLLIIYRNAILFNNSNQLHKILYSLCNDLLYFYYVIFIAKLLYSHYYYFFITTFIYYLLY
jgi:hypothetical protein